MNKPVEPGQWLGMLGGGQLGRMFAQSAQSMGYRVAVFEPDRGCPAGQIADRHFAAQYDDNTALDAFTDLCAAVSVEFENVPEQTLAYVAERSCLRPNAGAFALAKNRIREKQRFETLGVNPVPWRPVQDAAQLQLAWQDLGPSTVLKTAQGGYDGKGQWLIEDTQQLAAVAAEVFDNQTIDCVLEKRIELDAEYSVVLARSHSGDIASFPIGRNEHRNGILFSSTVPAEIDPGLQDRLNGAARAIAIDLDYIGVMAVEFFVDKNAEIYSNEMAPRPHNSGHYTQNACTSSQFEQQVRATAGLSLGSPVQTQATVMLNLLGELWERDFPLNQLMHLPGVHLHLYGKAEARRGRKMGHINITASTMEQCLKLQAEIEAMLLL